MRGRNIASTAVLAFLALTIAGTPALAQTDSLSWEECEAKVGDEDVYAECTTLTVPENREDPGSRQITITVRRIPATGGASDVPIFRLEGGPGKSNLDFSPPAALIETHDFVQVGYRGVDSSVVLDCPEFENAVKGKGNDLFSGESQAGMAAAIADCGQRLIAEDVDLDGYSILEVVNDMEDARFAMAYERIHLLSESYGTRVAQAYAQRFPDSIARSAMIGVNPPGRFVWEPEMIDYQLGLYSELCAQDSYCSQRTSDLAETIRKVNQDMPDRWLAFPIDPGKVKVVAFAQLYHTETAPIVIDAYLSAAEGDSSGLFFMSFAYGLQVPSLFVWGDTLAKGHSADFDPDRDYSELADPDSIMGSPIAQLLWPFADGWPMTPMPDEYRQVQPSSVDTLIINGDLDFSTPAENATNELLPYLENGQEIILTNMGHTDDFWGLQPDAAAHLLVEYYDTGTVNDSLFEDQPVVFEVAFPSFPTLGKAVFLVPLTLVALISGLVWWRIRRRRRKSAGSPS